MAFHMSYYNLVDSGDLTAASQILISVRLNLEPQLILVAQVSAFRVREPDPAVTAESH